MDNIKNIDLDFFNAIINQTIDFYHEHFLEYPDRFKLISLLQKLKMMKKYHGKNHPSMPDVLNLIGNIIYDHKLPQLAILFFKEQLRIERYYLGSQHQDLASTLNKIGEMHLENHQLSEAEECFTEVILMLKHNK